MVDVVRARVTRSLKVAGLASLLGLAATGCAPEVLHFGWPEGVTPEAEQMRQLWLWAVLACLIVGAIVWGLMAWSVIFHRRRSQGIPRQTQYNLPLEVIYTVIPFVIISVLFYFTVTTQNFVANQIPDPDTRVRVVAFQWNWEFIYLQDGNKLDQQEEELELHDNDFDPVYAAMTTAAGTPVSTVGTSNEIPLLVVPAGQVVEFRLFSRDVIHSFFVPDFLFKRDVFPMPRENSTDNVFQVTIQHPGAFVGRCAELCGTYHAYMNFEVRALPDDVFDRYLALRQQINPETGQPYTASEALRKLDCGRLCSPDALTTHPFRTATGLDRAPEGVGS